MAASGIPFDADLVRVETTAAASGYHATLELMHLPEPPTALFCFNDTMAMGAYDALRTLGLAIPEDMAVVGFDNLELIAAQLHPPLCTMELPYYQMGQWAVQYLLEHAGEYPTHGARSAQDRLSLHRPIIRLTHRSTFALHSIVDN